MSDRLQIQLLGEIQVRQGDRDVVLPASRKARALLGFLVATRRPHRRERLCELLWDLPDDPKAALRWSLSKLRSGVDAPDAPRILADRERVQFDDAEVDVDISEIHARLRRREDMIPPADLADMAGQLEAELLDGLDGAGAEGFDDWLRAEREDARAARIAVLHRLASHPDLGSIERRKWQRLWAQADPEGAAESARDGPAAPEVPVRDGTRGARVSQSRSRTLRAQRIGFCEVRDGTKIAFATVGSGPPILKAANWLSHLEFDWSSPIWGRSFAEIARERTFIRYDERGCGLSDWDVKDLSFDAFVEDLETVADTLGLERFPLIGISQGAAVSIEYAVRHPERVSGLILIGGYAAGWRHLAPPDEQERREAVMRLTELGWGTDNAAYRHIFSETFMPDAGAEVLAWFDDFQRKTTSPENAARFQEAFGWIDVRARLAEVRTPTIVLHSRHDQRIPIDMGRALASGIPGAQFVPLDSRNHILVDSEPAWRDCISSVAQFLAEIGG